MTDTSDSPEKQQHFLEDKLGMDRTGTYDVLVGMAVGSLVGIDPTTLERLFHAQVVGDHYGPLEGPAPADERERQAEAA